MLRERLKRCGARQRDTPHSDPGANGQRPPKSFANVVTLSGLPPEVKLDLLTPQPPQEYIEQKKVRIDRGRRVLRVKPGQEGIQLQIEELVRRRDASTNAAEKQKLNAEITPTIPSG